MKARAKAMATYSPTAAKKMLTDAGFTYKGNDLLDPKGNAVKLDIHVISGWSDWVASNQIITKNLRDIGIDSQVKLEPRLGRLVPERVRDEEPDAALAGRVAGLAVRLLLREPVTERVHPVGRGRRHRPGNWEHFAEPEGDAAAQPVEGDARTAKQKQIATQLQKIWLQTAADRSRCSSAPRWSTYSTKYFHCFPTQKNFYGDPIFTTYPDNILSVHHASARAGRPGRDRALQRPVTAGGPSRRPPAGYAPRPRHMRWFARRLVFYVFALWVALTINFLLPRLMPGTRSTGCCSTSTPAQLAANPGSSQTYQALLGGGDNSIWQDYVTYLGRDRALRLRHLDLELPDARLRGHRPHAAVLDLPRRRRVPPLVRHRDGDRDGRRLAPRRRRRQRRRADASWRSARSPRSSRRSSRVYFLGLKLQLVPDPARL